MLTYKTSFHVSLSFYTTQLKWKLFSSVAIPTFLCHTQTSTSCTLYGLLLVPFQVLTSYWSSQKALHCLRVNKARRTNTSFSKWTSSNKLVHCRFSLNIVAKQLIPERIAVWIANFSNTMYLFVLSLVALKFCALHLLPSFTLLLFLRISNVAVQSVEQLQSCSCKIAIDYSHLNYRHAHFWTVIFG